MIDYAVALNFLVAIALGALIGLEREYAQMKRKFKTYAGIRTFTFIALLGALGAYFAQLVSVWILIILLVFVAALTLISYFAHTKKIGATTEVASLLVFLLGALPMYGFADIAVALGILLALLLYLRLTLHKFTKKINSQELYSTLKFAIIAFVILPFLPNKAYGPLGGFNPYLIWLMVVFVTGITFAGYILVKLLGRKGLGLTGILGGLVSSTAVAQSMSSLSKRVKDYNPLVLAIVASNSIMFLRVMFEVFIINRSFFFDILLPMGVLAIVGIAISVILWFEHKKTTKPVQFSSPFRLFPALQFAFLFGLVLFFSKLAATYSSSTGIYLTSFFSGFVDMDAITISMASLAGDQISTNLATQAIMIAALTNTMVKAGIAYVFGAKKFA